MSLLRGGDGAQGKQAKMYERENTGKFKQKERGERREVVKQKSLVGVCSRGIEQFGIESGGGFV